jgi:hypothetical protein
LASPGNEEQMRWTDQRTTMQPRLSTAEHFGHATSQQQSRWLTSTMGHAARLQKVWKQILKSRSRTVNCQNQCIKTIGKGTRRHHKCQIVTA